MRMLAVLLMAGLLGAQDAREILKRAMEKDQKNYSVLDTYLYEQKTIVKMLEKDGRVKESKENVDEIFHFDGSEIEKRIVKDGKPLSAKELASEQKKVDRQIEKIKKESPHERAKRRGETEKDKREELEGRREILEAYDLKLLGTEQANGRDCWKLLGNPRPGFNGKGRRADQLKKLKGTVWIDRTTSDWVRIELDSTDTISFGWFLFRLQPNANIKIDQGLVNNEVWLPQRVDLRADARLLGKMSRIAVQVSYGNFRKFSSESKLIPD